LRESTYSVRFEEFNAYEYARARSLDQALLIVSKEQIYQPAANEIAKRGSNSPQQWFGWKRDPNPPK
jgi:hypothetical protein